MSIRFAALALALLAPPAAASMAHETRINVALSNFEFTPDTIEMKAGQAYILHLTSDGGHSFEASAFFAAAKIAPADASKIAKGKIELDGGDSVEIHLVAPTPGSYEVHCTHFLHASRGMKGKIVVS